MIYHHPQIKRNNLKEKNTNYELQITNYDLNYQTDLYQIKKLIFKNAIFQKTSNQYFLQNYFGLCGSYFRAFWR